jgi:hypothetical protein
VRRRRLLLRTAVVLAAAFLIEVYDMPTWAQPTSHMGIGPPPAGQLLKWVRTWAHRLWPCNPPWGLTPGPGGGLEYRS